MREANEDTIRKPNVTYESFLKVIGFIYTGIVRIDDADAIEILAIADELQLEELKDFAEKHLTGMIVVESCLTLLDTAYRFSSDVLLNACFDFIKRNTMEVLMTPGFLEIGKDTAIRLFDSECLAVDELLIFAAMIRWGLKQLLDCKNKGIEILHEGGGVKNHDSGSEEEEEEEETVAVAESSSKENEESAGSAASSSSPLVDVTPFPLSGSHVSESQDSKSNKKLINLTHIVSKFSPRRHSSKSKRGTLLHTASFSALPIHDCNVQNIGTSEMSPTQSVINDDNEETDRFLSIEDGLLLAECFTDGNAGEAALKDLALRLHPHDRIRLRIVVEDLEPFVRFPLMKPYQLTDIIELFEIVPQWLLLEAYRHIAVPTRGHSKRTQKRKGLYEQLIDAFGGSTILNQYHKQTLNSWCDSSKDNKKQKWTLLYKASRDGFDAKIFHEKCDDKGPTIVVCCTADGYIFGGYNNHSWTSKQCWIASKDAFLFSLINPFNDGARQLKVKNPSKAIYCDPQFGPCFGGGGGSYFDPFDLCIDSSMKRGHSNVGCSYSSFRGGYRTLEAQKSLAGSLNNWNLIDVEIFFLK